MTSLDSHKLRLREHLELEIQNLLVEIDEIDNLVFNTERTSLVERLKEKRQRDLRSKIFEIQLRIESLDKFDDNIGFIMMDQVFGCGLEIGGRDGDTINVKINTQIYLSAKDFIDLNLKVCDLLDIPHCDTPLFMHWYVGGDKYLSKKCAIGAYELFSIKEGIPAIDFLANIASNEIRKLNPSYFYDIELLEGDKGIRVVTSIY